MSMMVQYCLSLTAHPPAPPSLPPSLPPGPEFAERIKLNEAGNAKFNFLSSVDPYHAYFQHKIEEIREGVQQEALNASQRQLAYKVGGEGRGGRECSKRL